MRIIGLTGGIASGKSSVSRALGALGVPVCDADVLGREVMEPGTPAHAAIAARWPQVLRPDQTIDRASLAAVVFADHAERVELEGFVLPRILERFGRWVSELEAAGKKACVFEAATLFEQGLESLVDATVVVRAPESVRIARLAAKGLTEAQARSRMAAQLPDEEKVRRATFVVENAGTEGELAAAAARLWERIERG